MIKPRWPIKITLMPEHLACNFAWSPATRPQLEQWSQRANSEETCLSELAVDFAWEYQKADPIESNQAKLSSHQRESFKIYNG